MEPPLVFMVGRCLRSALLPMGICSRGRGNACPSIKVTGASTLYNHSVLPCVRAPNQMEHQDRSLDISSLRQEMGHTLQSEQSDVILQAG